MIDFYDPLSETKKCDFCNRRYDAFVLGTMLTTGEHICDECFEEKKLYAPE